MHQEINAEIFRKIRYITLKEFCRDLQIHFSPFLQNETDLQAVYLDNPSKKQRIVSDIHLVLIKKTAELIKLNEEENTGRRATTWHIFPVSIIESGKIEIAQVPKSAINDQVRFALIESVKLVPFKPLEAYSFANLLGLTKDELIKAIRNGRITAIRMLLSQYENCIGAFLTEMDKFSVYPLLEDFDYRFISNI